MKVEIDVNDLREAMYGLKKVRSKTSTLSCLGMLYIRANGGIKCVTSDLDNYVQAMMKGRIHQRGEVAIDFDQLHKVIKKIWRAGGTLTIETEDDSTEGDPWVTITHPKLTSRMPNAASDFPTLPPKVGDWTQLSEEFRNDFGKVVPYASNDDARPNLTGVDFHMTDQGLTLWATDGHRACGFSFADDEFEAPDGYNTVHGEAGYDCIVDKRGLYTADYIAGRTKTKGKKMYLGFSQGEKAATRAVLKFGRYEVFCHIKDKTFPDLMQVRPPLPHDRPIIERKHFEEAVDVVSIFASPKTNNIRMYYKPEDGHVEFYASDPRKGEGKTDIPADVPDCDIPEDDDGSNAVKVGFNYKYVDDVLDTLEGGLIEFVMLDTLSPVTFNAPGQRDKWVIVMPMRL